ncbi:MAG: hypothetical protein GWP74_09355 [Proteobacteria bacterium]|nr:hypothetical protein [Pseudomonadota bacterium]
MSSNLLHRRAVSLPALVMAILAHLIPATALAADRVALIIGNADYPSAPLRNPVNDARAMSRALRNLEFEVFSLENANKRQMEQAIVRFASRLKKDSSGLFYYAGHGVQVNGRNFLIPVDADIDSEREIRIETVGVNVVLDELGYVGNRMNIVILDACRNNPFERRLRGGSRGLAAIDAARGTLIAYATAPGSVALDGDGQNGIYTEELLSALQNPGLQVEEVFKRVRIGVARRSRQQQIPWESSSLTGSFVFNAAPATSTAQGAAGNQAELLFWQSVSRSDNPDTYRAYLRQFPEGMFTDLARIRLEDLQVGGPGAKAHTAGAPAQGTLLAKAEPEPSVSEKIMVIGIIEPQGTVWGYCEQGVDGDAIATQAGEYLRTARGFSFLHRWHRNQDTRGLWKYSGPRPSPYEEKIQAYGKWNGVDGVLVFRYEASGSYCARIKIEAYLYDVARETSYQQKGELGDVARMTGELTAKFAKGRGIKP